MLGLTERLYFQSPFWLQQAMVTAYGWWWYHRRFSEDFHRLANGLKARERWTAEQFRNYQEVHLEKVFKAAWNSPYYRQIFSRTGVTMTMAPFEILARLPILSKETLRVRVRELLTGKPPWGSIVQKTSGTTGTPTMIYYTREFHALEVAAPEARAMRWAGVNYRDRRVMFGVRKVCKFDQDSPPFWRFSPTENMAYASIYHLSPNFLPSYIEFLRSYKPAVIMGYPSALSTVARYALDHDTRPAPARAVFTMSETLQQQDRSAIESTWQCRVYDRYGAVEGCVFASQCEYGSYHVSPEIGVVEIVDDDGQPVPPGVMGKVICTGLHNTLQPLIRYQIGDVACWAPKESCLCGRQMPILTSIEGRSEDICYTSDGREMLRFDTVFKGIDNIQSAQVVQEKWDRFTVYVVPTDRFSSRDAEKIRDNMCLHVGNVITSVEPVSLIPRTPSGKFRAVVCKLSPDEKRRSLQLSVQPSNG